MLFLGAPHCQSPELSARFASPSLEASLIFSSEKTTASPTKSSFGFPIVGILAKTISVPEGRRSAFLRIPIRGSERSDNAVHSFVKNAGLGFAVPYLHNGQMHDYMPDFIIRLERRLSCSRGLGNQRPRPT